MKLLDLWSLVEELEQEFTRMVAVTPLMKSKPGTPVFKLVDAIAMLRVQNPALAIAFYKAKLDEKDDEKTRVIYESLRTIRRPLQT